MEIVGPLPVSTRFAMSAVARAMTTAWTDVKVYLNCGRISSRTKTIPASGALKTAPRRLPQQPESARPQTAVFRGRQSFFQNCPYLDRWALAAEHHAAAQAAQESDRADPLLSEAGAHPRAHSQSPVLRYRRPRGRNVDPERGRGSSSRPSSQSTARAKCLRAMLRARTERPASPRSHGPAFGRLHPRDRRQRRRPPPRRRSRAGCIPFRAHRAL
jgi:hypothetical protein